jgi:hypothetical protein
MDQDEVKRRAKRKDFLCEIQARFTGQSSYITLAVKDISASGLRVISPRLAKAGDNLEIRMCLIGRDIQCQAKVVWALLLRPGLGNVNTFDMGIEFIKMNAADREFLEKLTEK